MNLFIKERIVRVIKALNRIAMVMVVVGFLISLAQEVFAKGAPSIPIIGHTADGKYPIYQLSGALDDVNYISGDTLWQPDELLTRMRFLKPQDVNHGYQCDWVCKDSAGHIVGLNPANKGYLKIK